MTQRKMSQENDTEENVTEKNVATDELGSRSGTLSLFLDIYHDGMMILLFIFNFSDYIYPPLSCEIRHGR